MTITVTCNAPTYKIDTGIPPPAPQPERPHYHFRIMNVGDSFLIPDTRPCAAISHGIYNSAKRAGIKVTVRSGKEGVRVWRVQ